MIPYARQDITEADIEAVVRALRSDLITQGPLVPAFEQAVAGYCGAGFGVAVNSATSALHLACLALGLGPGDLLWTSPITFVASANCALYCGAQADFVDVEPESGNLSVSALEAKLRQAGSEGRLPRILVAVHMAGLPCDMRAIHGLAREYGFSVIEDASHALGARYRDEPVGSGRYSDITVFSFHPVKLITSAEGGMAVTNDPALAERMRLLRSHGIVRDPARLQGTADGPWYYEQQMLGYNYRMNDLEAALGNSQLTRLDAYVARRRELAGRYDTLLSGLPVALPCRREDSASAHHLYVIRLVDDDAVRRRAGIVAGLHGRGIGVQVHYIPVHMQPYFRERQRDPLPCAEDFYRRAITLPLYPLLNHAQQDEIVTALAGELAA